jgi:hypothetical protein
MLSYTVISLKGPWANLTYFADERPPAGTYTIESIEIRLS